METERLIIDQLKETDKVDYFTNISHDKKVLETFICRYAETLEEFDFSAYLGRDDLFAIRLKETGRLIGIILYFPYEKDPDACEIGYGIGSSYWNKGYVTEAAKCFIHFLFKEKKVKKVYASFFVGNGASKRVMEKCGMEYDHFVSKELEYLGIERDLTYYSIAHKQFVLKKMETDDEIKGKAYVHWKSWQEEYKGLVSQEYLAKLTLEKCEQMARSFKDNHIVAKVGDKVVGFVSFGDCEEEVPNVGAIFAIYVLSDYWGTGVAQMLMKEGLDNLSNYPKVQLWVLKGNKRAIRFYEKCGFKPDGAEMTSKNIGADEIRMTKESL